MRETAAQQLVRGRCDSIILAHANMTRDRSGARSASIGHGRDAQAVRTAPARMPALIKQNCQSTAVTQMD